MNDYITPNIFDGHNDVLLKLYNAGGVSAVETFLTGSKGAIDVPRAKAGGFAGGFLPFMYRR